MIFLKSFRIAIFNFKNANETFFQKGGEIGIDIHSSYLGLFSIQESFLCQTDLIGRDIEIAVNRTSDVDVDFLFFFTQLIASWNLDKNIYTWQNLTRKQKKIWLQACVCYNGLQCEMTSKNITIDCSKIFFEEDLYCYLGEEFFGLRGYIGASFNALDDSLCQIKNKQNSLVHFINFSILKKRFDTKSNSSK